MSQYYYAVASLPTLYLDSETYPTQEEFLAHCAAWLTPAELDQLHRATLQPPTGRGENEAVESEQEAPTVAAEKGVLGRWMAVETGLRNELVRLRASRLHVDEEKQLVKTDEPWWLSTAELEARASEAMGQSNPLRAEQVLDEYRWEVLEQLEVGHFFDVEKLIIYYLKLQILYRRASMGREAGKELFDTTYNTIIDRYYSADQEVENQT